MLRGVLSASGRWCLILLILCLIFQVMFVAMAYAVARFTDPPACQIGYAFPLPFAECPGLRLASWAEYALALPGGVLALPFVLPNLVTTATSPIQPFVLIPLVIHLFAWGYALGWLIKRIRAQS